VRLWRLLRGHESVSRSLSLPVADVEKSAFSPDGRTIALAVSTPAGSEVKLWDLIDNRQRVLAKGQEPVALLAFSPDGMAVGVATRSGALRVLDVATGTERYRAEGVRFDNEMEAPLTVSPEGLVAFGRRDVQGPKKEQTTVWLKTLTTGEESVVLEEERISGLSFSPDGQLLAIARGNKGDERSEVVLLDPRTGTKRFVLGRLPGEVRHLAFSPDCGKLAAIWVREDKGGLSGGLQVWNLRGERPSVTLREDRSLTISVSFSRDGQILVSGGMDGAVRIWDVEIGLERAVIKGLPGGALAALSRDGKNLVAVVIGPKPGAGSVKVWDVSVPATLPSRP
jgi:WD40 repeat protein